MVLGECSTSNRSSTVARHNRPARAFSVWAALGDDFCSLDAVPRWRAHKRALRRFGRVVSFRRAAVVVVVTVIGCGSTFIVVRSDGGVDGNEPDARADVDSADAFDWFAQFDGAQSFEGLYPPAPGEFPPTPGDKPCGPANLCLGETAHCDIATGWCCSGELRKTGCVCGQTYGCLPPEMCCDFPDADIPICASSVAICRDAGGKPPWEL